MINIPEVKIGLVAVSRDCFPASLAINRRKALAEAYKKNFNDKDFWKKLRRMAYKVGSKMIYYALVLYYTFTDENTPAKYKAVIAGALGYFILPVDLIPDFFPFTGMVDDWAALVAAVTYVATAITPDIKAKAQLKLQEWFTNPDLGDLR